MTDDRSEVGIAYKESPLARVTISGSTTDALHTITLTADPGNRHLGVAGGGVVVDNGATAVAVVLVDDEFVTVEWLELTGGLDEGIEFQNLPAGHNKGVARNLLVHDVPKDGILVDDAGANVDVYNNIVYSAAGGGGIRVGTALTTGTVRIFNNTVYGNTRGGINGSGAAAARSRSGTTSPSATTDDYNVTAGPERGQLEQPGQQRDAGRRTARRAAGSTASPPPRAPPLRRPSASASAASPRRQPRTCT